MDSSEENRKRIIKISNECKEFITDMDGFVYWCPDRSKNGHFSSYHLRFLADELDNRNEKWQKNIDDYFYKERQDDAKNVVVSNCLIWWNWIVQDVPISGWIIIFSLLVGATLMMLQ
jgi:hypothetical protein